MKKLNIPNPPPTNKNAVGYKVTDGDKYPIIGFLYQYKDITKLATIGVDESLNELISSVDAPIYGEAPEEFPEVAIEKKDERHKNYLMEVSKILKEIFKTAVDCKYDGHKLKEILFPKYKDTKMKMHVTEDGHFRFDSFGKYPDINVNLKNMKKGKHTHESVIKELKSNIKKLEERMPGMPSQSAIASFSSAPHLTGAGAGMMPS